MNTNEKTLALLLLLMYTALGFLVNLNIPPASYVNGSIFGLDNTNLIICFVTTGMVCIASYYYRMYLLEGGHCRKVYKITEPWKEYMMTPSGIHRIIIGIAGCACAIITTLISFSLTMSMTLGVNVIPGMNAIPGGYGFNPAFFIPPILVISAAVGVMVLSVVSLRYSWQITRSLIPIDQAS